MASFWQKLPRPFFVLAPMEDVTDTVFRRLVRQWSMAYGSSGPAVMFSEFTRVDGAMRAWELHQRQSSQPRLPRNDRLVFTEFERPLVAQLWGTRPDEFYSAATAIERLGFDGIDINMGCPARKIRKAGACSQLIRRPELASEIIAACRAGSTLPVSVKTRIGLDRVVTAEWIGFLLDQEIDALTIHGRIADQLSEGEADWDEVAKAVSLKNERSVNNGHNTVIIGNGDIYSMTQGMSRVRESGVDGVMIGRGIFYDPLFFARSGGATVDGETPPPWNEIPLERRLTYLKEQINAFTTQWGERRNYEVLKKFFRNYVIVSSAEPEEEDEESILLDVLYETHEASEALTILDRYLNRYLNR